MQKAKKVVVLGIGGAGCSAVQYLATHHSGQATYMAINDKEEHLDDTATMVMRVTNPLEEAFEFEQLKHPMVAAIGEAHLLFVLAGLGGKLGSLTTPAICEYASRKGLSVAVCATLPFRYEGQKRRSVAQDSIEKIRRYTNTIFICKLDTILQTETRQQYSFGELVQAYPLYAQHVLQNMTDAMQANPSHG